jgi:two-component system cell cycle response regulator
MRILLADDDDLYRHYVSRALERWGYEIVTASEGNEAMRILQGPTPPKVAILDWMMPGMNGVEICSHVRQQIKDVYIYIILITAKNQKNDVITGLDAQADDYLIKPFELEELRARLKSGCRIINMQAALDQKQQELRRRAAHDSLTGIWNHSAILDILNREMDCARSMKRHLCIALADIDKFKCINDTYGHEAGDAVLSEVVRRMESAIRSYDEIGRYGGDEFLAVIPGVGKQKAFMISERLRMRVAKTYFHVQKAQVPITVSIGVAVDDGSGMVNSLFRSVDEALYRAKARGRNCVEVAWADADNVSPFKRRRTV